MTDAKKLAKFIRNSKLPKLKPYEIQFLKNYLIGKKRRA